MGVGKSFFEYKGICLVTFPKISSIKIESATLGMRAYVDRRANKYMEAS